MLIASVTLMVLSSHGQSTQAPKENPPPDAINAAQTPSGVPLIRPEQTKNAHDRFDLFDAPKALPSSTAFENQPDKGQIFVRFLPRPPECQAADANIRGDHAG